MPTSKPLAAPGQTPAWYSPPAAACRLNRGTWSGHSEGSAITTNVRLIKVHDLRHTTASLLKKLKVPPRDAQMILGRAHISTTLQTYTHVDDEARDEALEGLGQLLSGHQ